MRKNPEIFLRHILESIKEIENYTKRISKAGFSRDVKTQDAVVRRMEIIGEAVKNLPKDFKKKHPEISWQEIAGMRDMLIHEYFGIDFNIVWRTVKKDIPQLKKNTLELLKKV